MKGFYIESVEAAGPMVALSKVEFQNGVNIIYGLSNTGKSMVIDCIDYMLGANEAPFNPADTKYDTVRMTLKNDAGNTIRLERKVLDEDGSSKSDSSIHVDSDYPHILSGDYSTGQTHKFSNEILKLMGIDEPVEIIANQEGRPQSLTLRSFAHQFFLKEDTIFTKKTIIDNPKHSAITPSITALMYLLEERGTVEEDYESSKVKKAKKKAVQNYISEKFRYLEDRNERLAELIGMTGGEDPEQRIEEILAEISQTQQEIEAADKECREIMADILSENSEMQEAQFLQDRYGMLRTQYEADIERLQFIVEGESSGKTGFAEKCPFCSHEITDVEESRSYVSASFAELEKVRVQLKELTDTQEDLNIQIADHMANLGHLHHLRESIQDLIKGSLKPRMEELREALKRYREIVDLTKELEVNESMYELFNLDYSVEEAKETKPDKFDAKVRFDDDLFVKLSLALSDAIKKCGYAGFRSASLSRKKFDAVVNDKDKKDEGKGYRAFLNSVFAFVLMKFLEQEGKHAPKMLVLDSPILSLKEDEEAATSGMKTSLFQYIIDNTGDCQVIIAENELPTEGVDYKDTKKIHFTKKEDEGTYGFLVSHRS